MSALTKILTGAAGLAAVVGFASPAAAQYGYGYPNQGNVVGQILQGVLGYGQYPYGNYGYNQVNQRYAVDQCARAVEARLNGRGYGYGGYGGYGGYNQGYGGYGNQYGYNQGYGGGGRVLGITRVERKDSGLRVRGVATSGGYGGGYGGYGYNQGYGQADLSFSCKVSYRGRITDLDIDRRGRDSYYRGY